MTPRTKIGRDLANTRWHGGVHQELNDIQRGKYQPLNPATFNQPAPAPLPFMSVNPKVREWVDARKARQQAEANPPKAIVPVGDVQTVRAELVVYKTENFKVVCIEHWLNGQLCFEVKTQDGVALTEYSNLEVAKLYVDEHEAFKAFMASVPTFNHALEDCPF